MWGAVLVVVVVVVVLAAAVAAAILVVIVIVVGENQYQWKCVSLVRKTGHTLEVYKVHSDSFQADQQLTLLMLA